IGSETLYLCLLELRETFRPETGAASLGEGRRVNDARDVLEPLLQRGIMKEAAEIARGARDERLEPLPCHEHLTADVLELAGQLRGDAVVAGRATTVLHEEDIHTVVKRVRLTDVSR